jgi:hypothetical protein
LVCGCGEVWMCVGVVGVCLLRGRFGIVGVCWEAGECESLGESPLENLLSPNFRENMRGSNQLLKVQHLHDWGGTTKEQLR